LRKNAEKKLIEKNLDMIVANTPAAISSDKSTVHIKTSKTPWIKIENASKTTIAQKIILLSEELIPRN
jgi:phosphopantothenoylcysteine synthetase/decarboxylase